MATCQEITADSTMQEVLDAYPGAQRALMRRYHIGGCSSCGFSPTDRLGDVLAKHNVLNVAEVTEHLQASYAQEQQIQIDPGELAEALSGDKPPRVIDVRGPEERDIVKLDGALPATEELMQEMMSQWPKDTAIVMHCHLGQRSLEAASYLIGHGFSNVRSLRGGIDLWAQEVDPSLARY